MQKIVLFFWGSLLFLSMQSCKKKIYTEVVEVPLPAKESNMKMGHPNEVKADNGTFNFHKLPFEYSELEPTIDAFTMELHYSRHYLNATNAVNKLLDERKSDINTTQQLFKKLSLFDEPLRNSAGGYYNHTLYFEIISPKGGGKPKDTLASTINRDFGSFENFKTLLSEKANAQFGSGWAWLVVDKMGQLKVTTTANNDNPLMTKQDVSGVPILCIDLWEHAYYYNYQNQRKKYIDNFFKVVNWKIVEDKFVAAIKK